MRRLRDWPTGLGILVADPRLALLALALIGLAGFLLSRLVRAGPGAPTRARDRIVAAAAFGLALFAYLTPGRVAAGDAHSHVSVAWLLRDILAHGEVPIWTNRWYLGFPLGAYYGYLYHALVVVASLATAGDVVLATKLTLWSLHVASGLAAFRFGETHFGDRGLAAITATAYVISFQHLGLIVNAGAFPAAIVYLCLPLALHAAERFFVGAVAPGRACAWCGILLAAVLWSHVEYGLLATGFFFLAGALRARPDPGAAGGTIAPARAVAFLAAVGLLVAALAAGMVLPTLLEKDELALGATRVLDRAVWHAPLPGAVRALKLVLWSRAAVDWVYAYMGLTLLGLAAVGAASRSPAGRATRNAYRIAVALGLAYMILNPRAVVLVLFPICVLAGHGARTLTAASVRRGRSYAAALTAVLAALFIDLGPTLVQLPYGEVGDEGVGDLVRAGGGQPGRIAVLGQGPLSLWRGLDVVDTGASIPFGSMPQVATRAYPVIAAIVARAQHELDEGKDPSRASLDGLRLAGIRWVVHGEGRRLEVQGAVPAFFAPRLETTELDCPDLERAAWDRAIAYFAPGTGEPACIRAAIDRMEIHEASASAGRILVRPEILALDGRNRDPESRPADFAVLGWWEAQTRVRLRYRSGARGWLQLAYAWFPFNVVAIDGAPVRAFPSLLNLVALEAPAGEHEVTVTAAVSPLRRRLLVIDAAALVLALGAGLGSGLGRRR